MKFIQSTLYALLMTGVGFTLPCPRLLARDEPPPRRAHVMVSMGDQALMWGGYGGSATSTVYLRDTWIYDEEKGWARIEGATSPEAYRSCGAWDTDRKRVVAFGGMMQNGLSDSLHEFDPEKKTWKCLDKLDIKPSVRLGAAMTHIPGYGCLLTGGTGGLVGKGRETWLWNGKQWRLVTAEGPESAYNHTLTWDPKRKRAVQFGGILTDIAEPMDSNSTWEFDPSSEKWIKISTSESPPKRYLHASLYLPDKGVVIAYGHCNVKENSVLNDIWIYDGSAWKEMTSANTGAPRFCCQISLLKGNKIFLFGGEQGEECEGKKLSYRVGDSFFLNLQSRLSD